MLQRRLKKLEAAERAAAQERLRNMSDDELRAKCQGIVDRYDADPEASEVDSDAAERIRNMLVQQKDSKVLIYEVD